MDRSFAVARGTLEARYMPASMVLQRGLTSEEELWRSPASEHLRGGLGIVGRRNLFPVDAGHEDLVLLAQPTRVFALFVMMSIHSSAFALFTDDGAAVQPQMR